jgi:hypothetical protein
MLPWLWYFPDNLTTVLLLTSDDDWAIREHFEKLVNACDEHDARLTFYLTQPTVMDKAWFNQLEQRGYAFSLHPNIPPPVRPSWNRVLTEHTAYFRGLFDRSPAKSVRNHAIVWSGYVEGPQIQARHGFTWDSNYFTFPPITRYYMTGGGLPMRFATPSGQVLPSFQIPSQFSDETTLKAGGYGFSLGLEPDGAFELITGLAQKNIDGRHSMLGFNAHPVSFATYSSPLWEPVMAWAKQQGIPVWPVEKFAAFWEARREVRLRPIPRGGAAPTGLPQGLVARLPS